MPYLICFTLFDPKNQCMTGQSEKLFKCHDICHTHEGNDVNKVFFPSLRYLKFLIVLMLFRKTVCLFFCSIFFSGVIRVIPRQCQPEKRSIWGGF